MADRRLRAEHDGGLRVELVLVNGKNSNGRAHGETRTLQWTELPDHFVSQMKFWIGVAKAAASEGRFDTLQDTLESLTRRVTKALFPRRTETEHPTLPSVRHAAAARFKAAYVSTATTEDERLQGLAMVAALLGHASDATATEHYARADGRNGRYPVPVPVPDALERRVRRRYYELDLDKDPSLDTADTDQCV